MRNSGTTPGRNALTTASILALSALLGQRLQQLGIQHGRRRRLRRQEHADRR
ncbi:hypothetical protein FB465_6731 [Kitasatospora atroaurantiaca]|uniref:Uncharacterized protein n=1 Tax=Kitasatospora atroaurantiaca TaxID=285545 RepID=A0A561F116_9ACTN|nr:hypothetical protein FB465_6731 [Kitasatospora atroaurantiaca]